MKKCNFAIEIAIALVLAGLCASAFTYGAVLISTRVPSSGAVAMATSTVGNLGIYSDSACTQTLTSIAWGTVTPGESWWKTVYVRNEGSTQITLSMTTINWVPTNANGPLSLTWNREGTVLAPSQVSAAELKFSVAADITGITNFRVDVVFAGNS